MNRMLNGLDDVVGWTSDLGQTGAFADPLAIALESDGTRLALNEVVDVSASFDSLIASPLRTHMESLSAAQRDTDAIVSFISSLPGVVSAEGGLTCFSVDELRFEVEFRDDATIGNLGLDFGAESEAIDLSFEASLDAQLTTATTFTVNFGVLLEPGLSDEQAFFIRNSSIQLETDLHASAELVEMQLGYLEADANIAEANLDLDLQVQFNNLLPDLDGNITLEELNGFDVSETADINFNTNAVSATISVSPTAASGITIGTPSLTITGQANAPDVSLSPNLDFAELTNFANIDSQTVTEAFNSIIDAFGVLDETRSFEVELPFLDGQPWSFDMGEAFQEAVSNASDADLNITANSIAELSASLGIEIDYDSATNQVVIPFSIDAATQASVQDVNVEGSVGPVKNIEVSASASVEGEGTIDFEIRIDISNDAQPVGERVTINDMKLNVEVDYEAANIDGSFQYGIVGVEFDGGSVSGSVDYMADFIDKMTLDQLALLTTATSFLLDTPIVPTGTATFELGDLTVEGNLFPLDDVDITLGLDTLTWSPTFNVSGDAILDSLSNIDVDLIVTKLIDGIQATLDVTDYIQAWNDLVGVVPTTVPEIPMLNPSLLSSVGDGEALLLHELSIAFEDLPWLADLDIDVEMEIDKAAATVEFRFNATKSAAESFDFGLRFGEGLGDAIGDALFSGGEFAGGGGVIDGELTVELDVDVLLEATDDGVDAFLLDSSEVSADVYVNGETEFSGSLGVLGAEFAGDLIIAGDTSNAQASNPATITSGLQDQASGRYALDGSTDYFVETSATGELLAQYEFTVTPDGPTDDFVFEIDDLGDALDSLTVISAPDFADLMESFDIGDNLSAVPNALLDILQAIIDATNGDSGIFGEGFPVIGKLLAGDGNFLQDIYDKLVLEFDKIANFDPKILEAFLENALANAFGIQNRDVFDIDLTDPDDIRLTLDLSGTAFELSKEFDTDLGFAAIGASLNTTFEIIGSYDAVLTFGFSTDPDIGLYLDTSNEDLSFDIDVNLAGETGEPDFEGWLGGGFIAVQVENIGDDTIFHGEYTIDLTEPSGDDKLTVEEALNGNGPFIDRDTSGLKAHTGPSKGDKIELEISVEATEWAPSLYAVLEFEWQFDGFSSNVSPPSVEYTDVGIDLGGFVSHNFCPVIEGVSTVLDPLDPVVDIFQTEVPYVSDVLGPTTILDMTQATEGAFDFLPGNHFARQQEQLDRMNKFVAMLTTIDELGEVCETTNNARISFGSLAFDGLSSDLQEIGTEWLEENLDIDIDDVIDQVETSATDLVNATKNVNFEGGKIEFPIWENPFSAFEWLLGIRHVPIVTMDVAQLTIDLELPLAFTLGPVTAGLKGSLLVEAGISVGYDTMGFSDYFESGKAKDLFNGFYISDTDDATGDGDDIPEVSVTGGLALFAQAGLDGIAEVEVSGGLYADVNVDLIDHDEDGRMRGHEFQDTRGCIQIDGGVEISAKVEGKAFGVFEKDWPIGKPYDIAKFDRTYYCINTDETLAELDETDGTLTLLVGDRGSERSIAESEVDEDYTLSRDGDRLLISAFGGIQIINNAFKNGGEADQVTKIVAEAGSGNDTIEFLEFIDDTTGVEVVSSIIVPTDLDGGDGDDQIYAGNGTNTINGGRGNDIIHGGDARDIITTGGGNDVVEGGPGNDTIVGSKDVDIFDGGSGDDVLTGLGENDILIGGSGIDTINGGDGEDTISGGPDKDFLNGGDDDDDIFGDDGDDEIDGDLGDDYLDGGPGDDIINDDEGVTTAYGGSGVDIIDGGPLADELLGGDDNDTIRGHDGEDNIDGGEGNDTIEGGDDVDTIEGGPGEDNIKGEQGNDILSGGDGPDTIDGGSGEDEIDGGPGDDPDLDGGPGNDTIRGGTGDDVIYGKGGLDTLEGDSGDDDIYGGPQDDYINGNAGDDDLFGEDGEDEIYGESGDDEIEGGLHDDYIDGGPDTDTIDGDEGNDELFGGDGPDTIDGGVGEDEIEGGPGSDPSLKGGPDNDIIRGGSGNDFIWGEGGEDELRGDSGSDTIDGGSENDFIDGMSGGDFLYGRGGEDEIYGYAGNDEIEGGLGNDYIEGGEGHDDIWGDQGEDEIRGDSGNDLIYGGTENDEIHGGSGNDEIYGEDGDDDIFADGGNDYVEGNAGVDEIEGGAGSDELHGNEDEDIMFGGPGNDKMYGEGANDEMHGDDGSDQMYGGPGRDEMYGDEGKDYMFGEQGPDDMFGGPGNDTMRGGLDNDTMRGDEGDDLVLGNDGEDELFGGENNDVLRGNDGPDVLHGGPGNDRAMGGNGDDIIEGDGGNDILDGEEGNDNISGNDGRDELNGGLGVDLLNGGDHDDRLYAGEGIGNELHGGPGNDVIIGSDEGSDDPNLMDTIYFGDIIFGDGGNDQIHGLGGADIIDAGVGNDIVRGGTHGDLITGGPDASPDPDKDTLFGDNGDDILRGGADTDRLGGGDGADNLNGGAAANQTSQSGMAPPPTEELADSSSPGHSNAGNWKSIAGSASTDGLTQIGGFEQAIFAKGERVYAAWVDTRNGNTEIHAAYHVEGQPGWVSLNGPGGISDDDNQSRRPSIVATENQILVSWTSIDEFGNETVNVGITGASSGGAAAGPAIWAVTGGFDGDNSKLAPYPHGAILARINDSGSAVTEQYWACPGPSPNSGWNVGGGIGAPILGAAAPRLEIDLATTGGAAGIAATYELDGETYVEALLAGPTISFPETCPDPTGPGVIIIEVPRIGRWDVTPAITAENLSSPAIAIGNLTEIVSGPNDTPKTEHQIDVHVAWDYETNYENQVNAAVGTKSFKFGDPAAEPFEWTPSSSIYKNNLVNAGGETISDTIGYAAKPSLSGSHYGAFLAWMDDGVHQKRGDARSSIYVMSAGLGSQTYAEELPGNASGHGISRNGGALQSLSISVDPAEVDVDAGQTLHRPYVGWTDAITGQQQVYLRHDLNKSIPGIVLTETSGKTLVSEDGQTDTYTLTLTSQPSSDVTIKILSDSQLQTTPGNLVFTPGDWSTPQTVTVKGLDNQAVEGNRITELEHSLASTDAGYEDVLVPSLKVKIKDNDLNDDGKLDALDIDELFSQLKKPSSPGRTDIRFDVDDDGELNTTDVDFLVTQTFGTFFGDSDLDGDVDFKDFLELAENFGGKKAGWSDGDLDGDGEVSFADFLKVAKNFGLRRAID